MLLSPFAALVLRGLVWVLAFLVFVRLARKNLPPPSEPIRRALLALCFGAVLGSKLVYLLTFPQLLMHALSVEGLLVLLSGNSSVGALLGAWLILQLTQPQDTVQPVEQALTVPLATALLILAVGAGLIGVHHPSLGAPTHFFWGTQFGDGVPRHPVHLLEALWLVIALALIGPRSPLGRLLQAADMAHMMPVLFGLGYFSLRLLLEYLKVPFQPSGLLDAIRPRPLLYPLRLTAEQWAAMVGIFLLLPAWWGAVRSLWRAR
jgi:prolipoprotein diacylglyceryltransferase